MITPASSDYGSSLYIGADGAPDFEGLMADGRIREHYDPNDWTPGDYTYSELDRALYLTGPGVVLWRWDGLTNNETISLVKSGGDPAEVPNE